MNKLFLSFPQWQGSGSSNELYHGAKLLTEKLSLFPFMKIDVPEKEEITVENNILGYKSLMSQLTDARNVIKNSQAKSIFTLGGGCDVEIIPISYLNKVYLGNVAVVWVDAHADLNTPESSPSKNFHGMPLRLLLGDGDIQLKSLAFSKINPNQVFLFGVRDLDSPEKEYISNHLIPVTTNPEVLVETIKGKHFSKVYIHLDLDSLDPTEFPFVKVTSLEGLSIQEVKQLVDKLKKNFAVVGGSVVEYSPGPDKQGLETASELARFIFK
jgi:arginase